MEADDNGLPPPDHDREMCDCFACENWRRARDTHEQFPRCMMDGCERTCSEPPCRDRGGRSICCECAVDLYVVCAACGELLHEGPFESYALEAGRYNTPIPNELDGQPVCERCWLELASGIHLERWHALHRADRCPKCERTWFPSMMESETFPGSACDLGQCTLPFGDRG